MAPQNGVRRLMGSRDYRTSEHGFTLIEVLVAIVILGILTTAALNFAAVGAKATATQERRQVAIAVATAAMEEVNARVASVDSGSGVSYLMLGRSKTEVQAAWTKYASFPGVGTTYAGWDKLATGASVPAIPVTSTVTRNGTAFTVVTLIGWCYQQQVSSDCALIPTYSSPPAKSPPGWSNRLIRAMTIVQWSAGEYCSPSECSYQLITFVDGSSDLEWVG